MKCVACILVLVKYWVSQMTTQASQRKKTSVNFECGGQNGLEDLALEKLQVWKLYRSWWLWLIISFTSVNCKPQTSKVLGLKASIGSWGEGGCSICNFKQLVLVYQTIWPVFLYLVLTLIILGVHNIIWGNLKIMYKICSVSDAYKKKAEEFESEMKKKEEVKIYIQQ